MGRIVTPFRLLFVIAAAISIQACATPYGKVLTQYRETEPGFASLAELPVEPIDIGDKKSFDLGEGSPLYRFDTGKSYFRVFALPKGPYPYRVTVSSYLVGESLKSAYLFYPQLLTLDEKRQVVRMTGPETFTLERAGLIEGTREARGLRDKLEGGLTFTEGSRDERYLVVLTTDGLRKQKTPVPLGGGVPMFLPGFKVPVEHDEVRVPNSPAGRLNVMLAAVPPGETETSISSRKSPLATPQVTARPVPTPVPPAVGQPATPAEKSAASATMATVPSPAAAVFKPANVPGTTASSSVEAPVPPPALRPVAATIRLESGKVIGELELGRATVDDSRRLLESAGAGLGTERQSTMQFSVGTTTLAAKRLYMPPGTLHQLYFDDKSILILVVDDGAPVGLPITGKEFRQRFPAAQESARTLSTYELQVPVAPCVTLIAAFRAISDTLDSAAYAYVCPTR